MLDIHAFPLVSDQIEYDELRVIIRELDHALEGTATGDVVEFGCYSGTTSLFIQRLLINRPKPARLHVYDSFAGLPPKSRQDQSPAGEHFTPGALHASKSQFIKHFRQAGLPLPVIHKSWFSDLSPQDIPQDIAFAFLDGDFYDSIKQSLKLIESRLVAGAIIIVDDYQSESLPGARRAVDEWLQNKDYALRSERSLAVIRT